MVIKWKVAAGIVESIADLRNEHGFEDFTVIVDGTNVICHRFILAACSHYFRALFRSGMRETEEHCVDLKDISYPTFTLILSALYTGYDVLTEDNVTDIWYAANKLQIGFLIKECETFVIRNLTLDNYEEMYKHAKVLDSSRVFQGEHKFMLRNFDAIRESQTFLELSFPEVQALVKSDHLVITSEDTVLEAVLDWVSYTSKCVESAGRITPDAVCEETCYKKTRLDQSKMKEENDMPEETAFVTDDSQGNSETPKVGKDGDQEDSPLDCHEKSAQDLVISNCSELRKGDQDQNNILLEQDRGRHLLALISMVRTCLVSKEGLEMFLEHAVIKTNRESMDVLLKAVYYHLQIGRRHGQWPVEAIHRLSSDLENVIVWASNPQVSSVVPRITLGSSQSTSVPQVISLKAYSFSHSTVYDLTSPSDCITNLYCMTAFDNDIYLITESKIYAFREGVWVRIQSLSSRPYSAVSCGNCIYLFCYAENSDQFSLIKVNLRCLPLRVQRSADSPYNIPSAYVTTATCAAGKILIFSLDAGETAVHCYDPSLDSWNRLNNLEGPVENLRSFGKDKDTYLLQNDGYLWKVENESGSLEISYCKKLWNFVLHLSGVVLYRKTLYIWGESELPANKNNFSSVPGLIETVIYTKISGQRGFVPVILPKTLFRP